MPQEEYEEEFPEDREPSPEDYAISDARGGGYVVSEVRPGGGKYLGTFREEWEAYKFILDRMKQTNFYPNVWKLSDHGNWIGPLDQKEMRRDIDKSYDRLEPHRFKKREGGNMSVLDSILADHVEPGDSIKVKKVKPGATKREERYVVDIPGEGEVETESIPKKREASMSLFDRIAQEDDDEDFGEAVMDEEEAAELMAPEEDEDIPLLDTLIDDMSTEESTEESAEEPEAGIEIGTEEIDVLREGLEKLLDGDLDSEKQVFVKALLDQIEGLPERVRLEPVA